MYTVKETTNGFTVMNGSEVVSTHSSEWRAREYANVLNHQLAVETYRAGDVDLSYEIAQLYTWLNATKAQWVEHAEHCINRKEIVSNANYE